MRRILITGANRGIGLETVRQLATHPDTHVLAAVREPGKASELRRLADSTDGKRVGLLKLDVASPKSIAELARELKAGGTRTQVLINNAGLYTGGKNPAANALEIMRVNYYGPQYLSNALRENLEGDALVINVSSGMGELSGFSKAAAAKLLREDITEDELDALADHYAAHGAKGMTAGWVGNPYSASKAVLNTLTRIRFRLGENMVSVCPGWVRTDMGGAGAPRSVEKGAETIVWLARGDAKSPGGKFYRDKKEIAW